MGGQTSQILRPEELHEFRRLHSGQTNLNLEIPERPENRHVTDKNFTIVFFVTLLVTLAFMTYALVLTKDLSSSSSSTSLYGGRYDNEIRFNVNHDRNVELDMKWERNWWKIICSLFLSLLCGIAILVLLRFYTGAVVWTSLVCSVLCGFLVVVLLWVAYSHIPPGHKKSMAAPVVATILFIIGVAMLVCLYKKIKLIILLFKEAAIALFSLPGLLAVPFIHLLTTIVVVAIFLGTEMFISLVNNHPRLGNAATGIAFWLNIVMAIWTLQFLQGFQSMLVAGSISTWYFAKNKRYLDAPIKTTLSNIFRFHLGSLFFGSMIITLIIVLRAILSALTKNEKLRQAVESCLSCIGDLVKYLTKNAYIETAIHGQPFWRSGKRAAKLLASNATDMIAVNFVGDAVIGMLVFFVMLINLGLSYLIFMSEEALPIYLIICFIVSAVVVSPIFSLFETSVDCLFICFCEDKEINDGLSRPFCMSRGLMEFIDKSKQAKAALEQTS